MDTLSQQGEEALKNGDFSLAQTLFRQAVELNPGDVQAWIGLSNCVESDIEKIQCLQTILKIDPKNAVATVSLDQMLGKIIDKENINVNMTQREPNPGPFTEIPEFISPAPVSHLSDSKPPNSNSILNKLTKTPPKEPDPLDVFRSSFSIIDSPKLGSIEEESDQADEAPLSDKQDDKSKEQNAIKSPWEITRQTLPEFSWDEEQKEPPEMIWDDSKENPVQGDEIKKTEAQAASQAEEVPVNPKMAGWEDTRKSFSDFVWNDEADDSSGNQGGPDEAGKTMPGVKDAGTSKPNWMKRISRRTLMVAGIGGVVLVLILASVIFFSSNGNKETSPALSGPFAKPVVFAAQTGTKTATKMVFLTPTPSETPTQRATRTPNPSPTYPNPNQTIQVRFKNVEAEVADLRGLSINLDAVPSYTITKLQANDYFRKYYSQSDEQKQLDNHKKALVVLGLVKPTFDMVGVALNHSVDIIGGFYNPLSQEIFIVTSLAINGLDYVAFAHEFDHALVDQHYSLKDSGLYPDCKFDSQHCRAIQAFLEGDATLLTNQWVKQYVSQKEVTDAVYSPTPYYIPEDQALPPFLAQDALFPYQYGTQFVQYYYLSGNWSGVNTIYNRLPSSTSQIIHPEKYIINKQAVDLPDDKVAGAMGDPWNLVENDVLGEWMSYLLLAFGDDKTSQIDQKSAKDVTKNWSGDRYQVFENKDSKYIAAGVHWIFESPDDADEFSNILNIMIDRRFRGNHLNWQGRICYQANSQVSCQFKNGKQVLWLVGPDKDSISRLLSGYTDFAGK